MHKISIFASKIINQHLKRIGLLSDTHGYIDELIIRHLRDCDEIWHAGDIGSVEVLERLKNVKPLKAVYGNIDTMQIRSVLPEIQYFLCDNIHVLMKHIGGYPGHYDPSVRQLIYENPPRLFISGHSHILKVVPDKKLNLLHINPGAAGRIGLHKIRTIVRFTINGNDIRDLEVVELEKR
jgi:putative phosphoesterase